MPDRDRYALLLEPVNGRDWQAVPVDVRVRRAMKSLGRSFGLRVVKVKTVAPKAEKSKVTP